MFKFVNKKNSSNTSNYFESLPGLLPIRFKNDNCTDDRYFSGYICLDMIGEYLFVCIWFRQRSQISSGWPQLAWSLPFDCNIFVNSSISLIVFSSMSLNGSSWLSNKTSYFKKLLFVIFELGLLLLSARLVIVGTRSSFELYFNLLSDLDLSTLLVDCMMTSYCGDVDTANWFVVLPGDVEYWSAPVAFK